MPSDQQSLHILCNHFKSRGYDNKNTADDRRRGQAEAVRDILKSYDLEQDRVVVACDLNGNPDRPRSSSC